MKTRLLKKLRRKFYYRYSDYMQRYHVYIGRKRYFTSSESKARKAVQASILNYGRTKYYKYKRLSK